jgi:hypothetical protein
MIDTNLERRSQTIICDHPKQILHFITDHRTNQQDHQTTNQSPSTTLKYIQHYQRNRDGLIAEIEARVVLFVFVVAICYFCLLFIDSIVDRQKC